MKALLYNHIKQNDACLTSPQHRHKHRQREITKAGAYVKEISQTIIITINFRRAHLYCSLHNIFAERASLASTPSRVRPSELKCVQFISLEK